jgi:MFS transporter, FSR family, fosmidomycin resistance protein
MSVLADRHRETDAGRRALGSRPRRTLGVACAAHALHDGYTDLIYVLLPVWQAEFGLNFAALAALRGLYAGTMAGLQIPAGILAGRWLGPRAILAIGTAMAAAGYALAGFSGGLAGVCLALILSGAGSSTQHPLGSAAVARAYGAGSRGPLGTYNFSGDLGKAALPAAMSVLLLLLSWRNALFAVAVVGGAVALAIGLLMPDSGGRSTAAPARSPESGARGRGGFALLFAIGVADTAVRMGLLTFLPFLLKAKGAGLPVVGIALSLVFMGGAAGKFACGWIGARAGVLATVVATEGGTAAAIIAVMILPLAPALVLLPLLGTMLNGTSSVLYGTVPELAPRTQAERAFALFYTGTIGSGAVAPILYGALGDTVGITWATVATAGTALAIVPLAFVLARYLPSSKSGAASTAR